MEAIAVLVALAAFIAFVLGAISLFRPIAWARIRSRKQAVLVMGASFLVFLVAGAFLPSPEEEEVAATSTTTSTEAGASDDEDSAAEDEAVEETTTTSESPDSTSSTLSQETTTTASLVSYEILEEEDVSFAGAVRYSLRVTVAEGATRADMRLVADEIARLYREERPYNALNIFFYHYADVANDVTTLGSWDDSPYGDWARAAEVTTGDYRTHSPNDQTKEKDWSLLPSPDQARIYAAYNETYYSLAETAEELPSDDEIIALVADSLGISAPEVEGAIDAFLDWTFNDVS